MPRLLGSSFPLGNTALEAAGAQSPKYNLGAARLLGIVAPSPAWRRAWCRVPQYEHHRVGRVHLPGQSVRVAGHLNPCDGLPVGSAM